MCVLTKIPKYRKRYSAKEMAAKIGVYEYLKYNSPQCRYVSHLLLLLLLVSYYYDRYCVCSFFYHGYTVRKYILSPYSLAVLFSERTVLSQQSSISISISQISVKRTGMFSTYRRRRLSWLTLDLLKSGVKVHQCWCMPDKLLYLTCSTWP
jgi:hypothetical protein